MKLFKPDDFPGMNFQDGMMTAEHANAKLEREGKVVFACRRHQSKACGLWTDDNHIDAKNTHQALLINLEPIEQCKHLKEKVRLFAEPGSTIQSAYYACECGAKVKPTMFEEENEKEK